MKRLIYTLSLLFTISFSYAQNDIKARVEFEETEKAFEAEEYDECLTHIEKTEKLIGRWTPMTSFLKIEALYAITDMGNFNDANIQALFVDVSKYMTYMNRLNSDEIPTEKYKRVYEIEKILKVHKLEERQGSDFIKAKELHDAKSYDEALVLWENLAQQDNTWAMRNLGLIYEIRKDYPQALNWYKRAVENGNAQGAFSLALLEVEGGKTESKMWYEEAARLGHPYGVFGQGQNAEHKDKDMQKALDYYLKAAALGCASGWSGVGNLYEEGKGVTQNFKKAEEYYMKAVKKNNGYGMFCVGYLYFIGGNGIVQSLQTAMQWFLKAADRGEANAMRLIGLIYERGPDDFKQDYAKAEEWFLKAAEAGNERAYLHLGNLYCRSDYEQREKAFENYKSR